MNMRPPFLVTQESPSLTEGAPHRIDASRFWAVLIDIDAYERNPLRGCGFLIDDLGVPKGHIQCLLGPENPISENSLTPSRANIVDVLYSLIGNPEIKRGDNIWSTTLGMAPATTAQSIFLYLNATILPVPSKLYALSIVTP
ncbi:hypothetical protein EDD85DRAFT_958400 [Armillaria nabsnona]|nr:hypothetical protein EDD85DRAFT_958400 [Armillaria nabsnona]